MNAMKVLIVINTSNGKAIDAGAMLGAYFSTQGIDSETFAANEVEDAVAQGRNNFDSYDMAIALGGDGTILHTANAVHGNGAPILGINFGHLGFLANQADDGVLKIVSAALAGDITYEKRANLHAVVSYEDGSESAYFALNEINLARGASGRIVDYNLYVSGDLLYRMSSDGLVVATATGSTAYALSAGGPLVAPGFQGLVVVPLAPHSITSRAVLTESNDIVEVEFGLDPSHSEVALFVDGTPIVKDCSISRVLIMRGKVPTTLLRYNQEHFTKQISRVFFK